MSRRLYPSPSTYLKILSQSARSCRQRQDALDRQTGRKIWCRQLVTYLDMPSEDPSVEVQERRVYFAPYPAPAFQCTLVGTDGSKHIRVCGPDGKEYTVHRAYAGRNPSVSVALDPTWYVEGASEARGRAHIPGTSYPDESTEDMDLRYTYRYARD